MKYLLLPSTIPGYQGMVKYQKCWAYLVQPFRPNIYSLLGNIFFKYWHGQVLFHGFQENSLDGLQETWNKLITSDKDHKKHILDQVGSIWILKILKTRFFYIKIVFKRMIK